MGSRRRQGDHGTGFSLLETLIAVSRLGIALTVALPSHRRTARERCTLAALTLASRLRTTVQAGTWFVALTGAPAGGTRG